MRPFALAAVLSFATLVVGVIVGYLVGRWSLDREWREPLVIVGADDQARSAANDADPTPKAGSKVMRGMPLRKTREAMTLLTAKDPVRVTVGSIGRGDDGTTELHLALKNDSKCEVVSLEGVAYGFDAWSRPAAMNRRGEHYVAFASDGRSDGQPKIDPSGKAQLAQKLRYVDTASVAVAQVDTFTCADGTRWARP